VCKPNDNFKARETFFFSHYHGPLGIYVFASSQKGIVCLKTEAQAPSYLARWEREGIEIQKNDAYHLELKDQLDAYFEKKLRHFTLPLDMRGTSFQRNVWNLLRRIPYGKTRSYGEMAKALGRPNAARAVGRAVGSNPVAIVVPCHRVIGSDGSLTGYGGGLERKTALLALEGSEVS